MKKQILVSIFLTAISTTLLVINEKISTFLLISFLIISFLIFYKITNYLNIFNELKNKSRIEILFLVIFFTLLFIPMSHIDKSDISELENRTLAKKPSIFNENNKLNYNYGREFNEWFNDRFYTRKYIVSNNYISYKLAKRYYEKGHFCLDKKTHWIVNTNVFKANSDLYSKDELNKAVYNIQKLKQFTDKNNIKLYILIAPRKEEIYPNAVDKYNTDFSQYKKTNQMKKYITSKTNVPIVYPFEELKRLAKTDYAYFKTDHHWTDEGAYTGYVELMKQIKKDFPNLTVTSQKDFELFYSNKIRIHQGEMFEGISYKLMNLHDKSLLDTQYKYFKYNKPDKISFKIEKCLNSKSLCKIHHIKNNKNTPNLTIYGDSFMLNLLQSMPYDFGKTEGIYVAFPLAKYKMKEFEKYIKEKKTNILVLCFCEIKHLSELYE